MYDLAKYFSLDNRIFRESFLASCKKNKGHAKHEHHMNDTIVVINLFIKTIMIILNYNINKISISNKTYI